MSGGSYDLLYTEHPAEWCQIPYRLRAMRDALAKRVEGKAVADEVDRLIAMANKFISEAGPMWERLAPVFKAIEWCESADCGEEEVTEALRQYNQSEIEKAKE